MCQVVFGKNQKNLMTVLAARLRFFFNCTLRRLFLLHIRYFIEFFYFFIFELQFWFVLVLRLTKKNFVIFMCWLS
jgi:hypothetical protein